MSDIIVSVPLVDQIYTDIKRKILLGTFEPDLKLTTVMLCDLYKISDTPIKQALNRLVADGLVEATPRRGMRVRVIDEKQISDSYKARLMIELYAVPYVIHMAETNKEFVGELKKLTEEHENMINTWSLDTYTENAQHEIDLSIRFHTMLVEATKNDIILSMYQSITNYTYLYYRANFKKSEEVRLSLAEHRQIIDCIERFDGEGLKNALASHLSKRLGKIGEML